MLNGCELLDFIYYIFLNTVKVNYKKPCLFNFKKNFLGNKSFINRNKINMLGESDVCFYFIIKV